MQTCPSCGTDQSADARFCSSCGTALQLLGEEQQELRIVTVLFADLAGSTALGDGLDPEDVRQVQAELFELLNAEVVRFGGTTEKFDEAAGVRAKADAYLASLDCLNPL